MIKRTGTSKRKQNNTAPKLPNAESETASYPFPSSNKLCAGRTLNAVSGSGAPKNVLGIQSWNVWERLQEIIKIPIKRKINSFEKPKSKIKPNKETNTPDNDSKIRAMLLTCNPGRSPVRIPVKTPKRQKRITKNKSIIT